MPRQGAASGSPTLPGGVTGGVPSGLASMTIFAVSFLPKLADPSASLGMAKGEWGFQRIRLPWVRSQTRDLGHPSVTADAGLGFGRNSTFVMRPLPGWLPPTVMANNLQGATRRSYWLRFGRCMAIKSRAPKFRMHKPGGARRHHAEPARTSVTGPASGRPPVTGLPAGIYSPQSLHRRSTLASSGCAGSRYTAAWPGHRRCQDQGDRTSEFRLLTVDVSRV